MSTNLGIAGHPVSGLENELPSAIRNCRIFRPDYQGNLPTGGCDVRHQSRPPASSARFRTWATKTAISLLATSRSSTGRTPAISTVKHESSPPNCAARSCFSVKNGWPRRYKRLIERAQPCSGAQATSGEVMMSSRPRVGWSVTWPHKASTPNALRTGTHNSSCGAWARSSVETPASVDRIAATAFMSRQGKMSDMENLHHVPETVETAFSGRE